MNLFLSGLLLFITYKSVKEAHWGIIGLFSIEILGDILEKHFSIGLLTLVFGGIAAVSFIFHIANKGFKIRIGGVHLILILYIIYITLASYDSIIDEDGRNWIFTYTQLLILMFIASNVISTEAHLMDIMTMFILTSLLSEVLILTDFNSDSLSEIENSIRANTTARYYLISIVFSFYFFLKSNSSVKQGLMLLAVGALLFGILISGSRSVLLFSFLAIILVAIRYKLYSPSIIFSALIVSFIFVVYLIPPDFLDETIATFTGSAYEGSQGTGEYNKIQNNVRLYLWEAGFHMLWDHNLFLGIGLGNYENLFSSYSVIDFGAVTNPHNTYFSVLFEAGIFGFIIFMSLIFKAFHDYKSKLGSDQSLSAIRYFWTLAFAILLLGGLTKHDHYNKMLFLMIGISLSIKQLIPTKDKQSLLETTPRENQNTLSN